MAYISQEYCKTAYFKNHKPESQKPKVIVRLKHLNLLSLLLE